jgi:hypothetical protein
MNLSYNIELTNLNNGYTSFIELPTTERLLKEKLENFIYSNWNWDCYFPNETFKIISYLCKGDLLKINNLLKDLSQYDDTKDKSCVSYNYIKAR